MAGDRYVAEEGAEGLLFEPAAATGAGILALPMNTGLGEQNRRFGRDLAAAGFRVLMWDPYPQVPADEQGDAPPYVIDDRESLAGQRRCVDYLFGRAGVHRLGVIGFCMGGRMALALAAREERLAACVSYFPTLRDEQRPNEESPLAVVDQIRCPVQVLYGAQDRHTRPATFTALRAALETRRVPTIAHVYPEADHGFLSDGAQAEEANRVATALSWPQSLAFLQAALR